MPWRMYQHTSEKKFLGPALRVARYSAGQAARRWLVGLGEGPSQRWIDNFHTGLQPVRAAVHRPLCRTTEFESSIRRGLEFYRAHFFREDGAPRYFHNRTYPVEIHSVAQSIITLIAL